MSKVIQMVFSPAGIGALEGGTTLKLNEHIVETAQHVLEEHAERYNVFDERLLVEQIAAKLRERQAHYLASQSPADVARAVSRGDQGHVMIDASTGVIKGI